MSRGKEFQSFGAAKRFRPSLGEYPSTSCEAKRPIRTKKLIKSRELKLPMAAIPAPPVP